jgi:hypothetical protein
VTKAIAQCAIPHFSPPPFLDERRHSPARDPHRHHREGHDRAPELVIGGLASMGNL